MLLPGTRAPTGAHVTTPQALSARAAAHTAASNAHHHTERTQHIPSATTAPMHSAAAAQASTIASSLPRTPPRTSTAGRHSAGGSGGAHAGASGSASRTPPGNTWGTPTQIGSTAYSAPRTPPGSSPPATLRTPGVSTAAAATCVAVEPPSPTGLSHQQQSSASRGPVNATRRPARKSVTERPSQAVRGGVRAGLPGSGAAHVGSGQAACNSTTVWSAPLRSTGRSGVNSSISARTAVAKGSVGEISTNLKVEAPIVSSPILKMASPPSPKWIGDDSEIKPNAEETQQERQPGVLRTLGEENNASNHLSSSPLSPLNERRQLKTAMGKGGDHEHATAPKNEEAPKLRPHLYHNYPTLGLYM